MAKIGCLDTHCAARTRHKSKTQIDDSHGTQDTRTSPSHKKRLKVYSAAAAATRDIQENSYERVQSAKL
jgi:hypothetical protein